MRILILSTDFKPRPGGIAEMSHQVARGLAMRGHEVIVATEKRHAPDWSDNAQPYAVRRVLDVRRFLSRRNPVGLVEFLMWSRRSRSRLCDALREVQPEVVMALNCNTLWLPALSGTATPFYQYVVGEDVAGCLRPRAVLARHRMIRTLERADGVIAISDYASRLVASLAQTLTAKVAVIPCGVPINDIMPLAARDGQPGQRLLTVARLELRKGIDTTLRAVGRLAENMPELHYTIVGDGPHRTALERLARELGLAERVEFTGYVSDEGKREIYLASDLYVMPSRAGTAGECEGFGISFLEANAHGLAVIGSTAGGIPDAVEHEVNGLLVPPGDVSALTRAIAALLRDPGMRQHMAEEGQKCIRERFNWDSIAERIESLMNDGVLRDSMSVPDAIMAPGV